MPRSLAERDSQTGIVARTVPSSVTHEATWSDSLTHDDGAAVIRVAITPVSPRRRYAGGVAASSARRSSGLSVTPAAARLSRTRSGRVVQGMGTMTGDVASSHASTT
jgi:hypothetical protein